ncbi:hypothetical protein IJX73_01595 [bacterium]|nr:hypothetical protein [bacterium]MBQ9149603.1 hypothetical protein [bacterium]
MNIPKITAEAQGFLSKAAKKVSTEVPSTDLIQKTSKFSPDNLRANFLPHKGKAPVISRAYIINGIDDELPLLATKINNSYLIDFDSQTEIMYGLDAVKYLARTSEFEYDTQIIFPKKAKGIAHIKGKDVNLEESSAIMINAGAKAQIDAQDGYPMVILSKRDYDWYERYGKDAKDIGIRNKFDELIYYNSHLYNGSFSPNVLLPNRFRDEKFLASIGIDKNASRNYLLYDIYNKRDSLGEEDKKAIVHLKELLDKLFEKGLIEAKEEGYIKATKGYESGYFAKLLQEEGFDKEDIDALIPVFKQARQVKMESVFTRKNSASDYPQELIKKMKEKGILYDNKKDSDINVYWKYHLGNEHSLRQILQEKGFSSQEQDLIVANWKKANVVGYDLSGLKFLDEDVAVYNLKDKLNNWTRSKTDWVTNSTALSSGKGETPFVGVSMVRYDGAKPETMAKIRGGQEILHRHPNLSEKRQTEVYLVTDGGAILNIERNGEIVDKLIKKGELVVIGPGVSHCVNSVSGNYEHVVVQLPSAFQYGFGFKENVGLPDGYDMGQLEQTALEKLTKLQESGNI